MELIDIWGKTDPFVPLIHHLIDTGCVAKVLLETPSYQGLLDRFKLTSGYLGDDPSTWLALLCSLHDIGKCHPLFQSKGDLPQLEEWRQRGWIPSRKATLNYHIHHESYGGDWLFDYLEEDLGWTRENVRVISSAVRGHHGSFVVADIEMPQLAERLWAEKRRELAQTLISLFTPTLAKSDIAVPTDSSAFGVMLAGLMVLSDWISSNPDVFLRPPAVGCLKQYHELSLTSARQAMKTLGFEQQIDWPEESRFATIFRQTFSSLRPVQEACEQLTLGQLPGGLVIIEAPMGQGKTEAALLVAAHWIQSLGLQGLYFALPTEATSNQMYGRVAEVLRRVGGTGLIKLVHGRSWLMDDVAAQIGADVAKESVDWFSPKKRALLAPYGVGTVDQALLAVLNVKHGFLRLFGLAGKVLVIDEVHAYDVFMSEILHMLLSWCRVLGTPVLLLSATLPANKRRELCEAYIGTKSATFSSRGYPMITSVTANGQINETVLPSGNSSVVQIRAHQILNKVKETALLAMISVESGGCVCVVANTVQSAQDIYSELRAGCHEQIMVGDLQLILYHARFPAIRRMEIEKQVLALFDKRSTLPPEHADYRPRPHRAILVATQVVEQSLDVDFDCMISELAPIDLLLQRCGRVHRHERGARPTGASPLLHVLLPAELDFQGTGKVYEPFVLLKTLLVVQGIDQIVIPQDIRPLIEAVYCDAIPQGASSSMQVALHDSQRKMQAKYTSDAAKALRSLLPLPHVDDFVLVRNLTPLDESDDGDGGYLHAATRLGDHTRRIIMVNETEALELQSVARLNRDTLKNLCLQQASVPRYWLAGVTPHREWMEPFECRSLSGVLLLPTKKGVWKGVDQAGGALEICSHSELGVLRIVEGR